MLKSPVTFAEKKDPGIPNSYPFKEELLLEAEAHKKRVISVVSYSTAMYRL